VSVLLALPIEDLSGIEIRDFIFFPESALKKLLKSKFSGFLNHPLIFNSIFFG
jgi:hypothetical protein